MQIPLYQERQAISTQSPGAQASNAGAAPWGAVAQLGGQIADTAFKGANIVAQKNAQRQKLLTDLGNERAKAEKKLLDLDIKNRISIAKNEYTSELTTRNDYGNFGTAQDKGFQKYQESVSKLLADPRLQNYPDTRAELGIHADGEIGNARIDAYYQGVKSLHNQGAAVYEVSFKEAIKNDDPERAKVLVDDNPFLTPTEKQAMLVGIPSAIQSNAIDTMVMNDPVSTVDLATAQLSGRETTWDALPKDKLKSIVAYGKQIINQRENATIDEIYKPDSEYSKLSPEGRQKWIDDKRNQGLMSASAWESEGKRIREPSLADATPADNSTFIDLQARIFAARGDKQAMTTVLNEVTASNMPRDMRVSLYSTARDVESPDSRVNSSTARFGHDLISTTFSRVKDDFASDSVHGWFGKGIKGFEEENRIDMMIRAESEARQEYTGWLMSQPQMPTSQEVQAKIYAIVGDVNKKYSVSQMPVRIRELTAPKAAPKPVATTPADEEDAFNKAFQ